MVLARETVQFLYRDKLNGDFMLMGISHNIRYLSRAQSRLHKNFLKLLPCLDDFLDGMDAEDKVGIVFSYRILLNHIYQLANNDSPQQNYKIFEYHLKNL